MLNCCNMEKIDYKTLIKLVEKYDEEASRVFNKLQRADQEAKTGILHYGSYGTFERIEWDYSDENSISVRYYDYGYDLYESATVSIPADILFDDKKIDKWVKSIIDANLKAKEDAELAKQKAKEEKERQEYERLKEKFGK